MSQSFQERLSGASARMLVFSILIFLSLGVALLTARFGWIAGMMVAIFPIVLLFVFIIITQPYWGLMTIFAVNYFIIGAWRYLPGLPVGIIMDSLVLLTFLGVIIQSCYSRIEWHRIRNGLTIVAVMWFVYCSLELFNPNEVSSQGWATGIRGISLYFMVLVILTPLLFYRYRDLKRILFMWSVFTLLAVAKAYWQKNHGFDSAELRWLFVEGGYRTHIIHTGPRYFSFYSDAGNFGSGMGLAMVVFSLYGFYVKGFWAKVYFFAVALAAAYGMTISGTRGAIAVPFAGYTLFVMMSRNTRAVILVLFLLVGSYVFLNHTTRGQGNQYVRRMRSAFNTDDPSLQVRLDNQRKLRVYMKTRPFGAGIGMGGAKARTYAPNAYLTQIPTDSWFVMVWVETGVIGLVFYIGLLLYVIFRGMFIVMFRIRDRELKGVLAALTAGVFGIMVTSYGNEIMGQFPNSFIVYMSMAFIYMGRELDKDIEETKKLAAGSAAAGGNGTGV